MKVQCKNCLPKEGIEIPDFTQLEKNRLLKLAIQSPIDLTKYIMDNFHLSHTVAKYMVTHINKTYGHCNCCSFGKLNEEYIICPKCGVLNFNWKMDKRIKI